MPQSHASDRLGPLDALFLYLEKKEMPLHIGSVLMFDGRISIDDLKSFIEAELPLIPRYRQRVVFPPLNAGYPTWEYDLEFDLDRHVRHARVKPGTNAGLETLAGELFSEVMDRNRPLWDLTVVDGLRGGRSALIARVHHCLVDGVAGVALMNIILDKSPEPAPLPPKHRLPAPPVPPGGNSLLDALISSYTHTTERLLSFQSAALDLAAGVVRELLQGSIQQALGTVSGLLAPQERFLFHAPALGPRKVSWAELPLAEVDAIRGPRGVKVNDVLMMILTGAVRRYARLHRHSVKNRLLRLMVPVNLRPDGLQQSLGNQISLIPVNIPLDLTNPDKLLDVIHERTEGLKRAHGSDLIVLGGTLLATLPVPVQAMLAGTLSNVISVLPFDMVCTNVPGPRLPLYLLGRKMLTYYPYVPIGDFMGVCCAMASYNGTLYFSLTGDCACAPDLDRLRDFLYEAYQELRDAAKLPERPLQRKPSRPRTRRQPVVVAASHVEPNQNVVAALTVK